MIFATDDDRPNNALERQGLKDGYKLTPACLRLFPFLDMLNTAVVQFARVLPAESRMVQHAAAICGYCYLGILQDGDSHARSPPPPLLLSSFPLHALAAAHKRPAFV
jgi:hypothetical protein